MSRTTDTSVSLSAEGCERGFQFASPFIVRHLGPAQLGPAWEVFCRLLRTHGLPLYSSVEALEANPVASVPGRMARRFVDEPFERIELRTADAFEVECRDKEQQNWGWPSELSTTEKLRGLVTAVREAAGGDTPVGLSLPIGASDRDVNRCLDSGVDFLTLVVQGDGPLDAATVGGLVHARRTCRSAGHRLFPLLLDAPVPNVEQAVKLLALGATAVSIDRVLRGAIPKPDSAKPSPVGGGMLSGISSVPVEKTPALPEMERILVRMSSYLRNRMRLTGTQRLSDFGAHCLKGLSATACQVSGIGMLGEND